MEMGWAAAIPAAITAISTLIIRWGAQKDKAEVKADTSTPWDVKRVETKVDELSRELTILKAAYFKQNPLTIDHRGPSKESKR